MLSVPLYYMEDGQDLRSHNDGHCFLYNHCVPTFSYIQKEEAQRLTRKKLALKRDAIRGQWAIRRNVEEDHYK